MKNKIVLSINHNNARRMQSFLNAVEDDLKEIPFEWKNLKLVDRITDARKFISVSSAPVLSIRVFFCDSYADANEIAKVNAFPHQPDAKWSVNGDLLYIVESEDVEKVSEILSLFAGEE